MAQGEKKLDDKLKILLQNKSGNEEEVKDIIKSIKPLELPRLIELAKEQDSTGAYDTLQNIILETLYNKNKFNAFLAHA